MAFSELVPHEGAPVAFISQGGGTSQHLARAAALLGNRDVQDSLCPINLVLTYGERPAPVSDCLITWDNYLK